MIDVVIIEDEQLAAQRLSHLLVSANPNIRVMAMLEGIEEAAEWFAQHPAPDLLFLDIQLEDGLSFELFDRVNIASPIIFTTAYDEYALRAFQLKSVDYLLKPIDPAELARAISKFKSLTQPPLPDLQALRRLLGQPQPDFKKRFSIQVGNRLLVVPTEEIAYFLSESKATFLVNWQGQRFAVDYSLDQLGKMLDPQHFFRVNRQWLVSLMAVESAQYLSAKGRMAVALKPRPKEQEVLISLDRISSFKEWLEG